MPKIPDYYLNAGNKNIKIDFKTINLRYENLKVNLPVVRRELIKLLN
ncbi:hypothetical protein IJD44_01465 [bacterium]|nr:hypothetical protein [bacterium]